MTETTLLISIIAFGTVEAAGVCGLIAAFILKRGPQGEQGYDGIPGPPGAMGPEGKHCRCYYGEDEK